MKLRIFFIAFHLAACFSGFAQNEFEEQLNLIIKDTSNRFSGFKGKFKGFFGNDSVFFSVTNLAGTDSNTVMISNDESIYILDSYFADIARPGSPNQGKKLADEWKDKLFNFLGKNFEMSRLNSRIGKNEYGWRFERGLFFINIVYIPKQKESADLLLLDISFAHLR